ITGTSQVMAQHNHAEGDHSGHKHAKQEEKASKPAKEKHKATKEFQQQLTNVFDANVLLKDAFVETDAVKVRAQAEAVRNEIAKVDKKQVQGKANAEWVKLEKELNKHIKAIASSNNIEEQRKHYAPFNDALY